MIKEIKNKKNAVETIRDFGIRASEGVRRFFCDESGMGTVEVILIIVVLIGLVIVFKKEIDGLVKEIFNTINTDAGKVTG